MIDLIKAKIEKIPPGEVFNWSIFNVKKSEKPDLVKAITIFIQKGLLRRLKVGHYYKPGKSNFQNSTLSENEILKVLTHKNGRLTGYLTGSRAYYKMGLTKRDSNSLTIATTRMQPAGKLGLFTIKYKKRNYPILKEDIELLQLLDAIRDIKKIPGTSVNEAFSLILAKLRKLSASELNRLVKLALRYGATTRALTGAMIEQYIKNISVNSLFKNLHPVVTRPIGLSPKLLPNKSRWRIQ